MNEPLCAAQPPFFSEAHAATIAAIARDKVKPHMLCVFDPSNGMFVLASASFGVVTNWVIQGPLSHEKATAMTRELGLDESKFTFFLMNSCAKVELKPTVTH